LPAVRSRHIRDRYADFGLAIDFLPPDTVAAISVG